MRFLMALSIALAAVSPARADSDVEHARYTVVSSAGDIEIRSYAPQIVAETVVSGAREAAIQEGFRRLAAYIFGANEPGGKIEMTAPVVQARGEKIAMTAPVAQERAGDAWKVRFTMPAKYTMETLPRPTDAQVRLVQLPGKRMAAIRFSGIAGESDLAGNEAKLMDFVKRQGLTPRAAPQYAFYDPPWTLPWNRRNEVLVELVGK